MTTPSSAAYVLIDIAAGAAHKVFRDLEKITNVVQVDIVTGPYDLVALVHGSDFNKIGNVVMNRIQTIEGVVNSITCYVIRLEA
jgi:DNA-binding Lrp family transcriptional regulator